MKDFPRRPADLTTAWLGSVLGVDLVKLTVGPIGQDRGNLGEIVRIDLNQGTHQEGPTSVVAKFAANRDEAMAAAHRSGLFEREVRFYEHLAPLLGPLAPRCYEFAYDPSTAQFVLVLEDLSRGTEQLDSVTGIGPTLAERALSSLADLHSRGTALVDQHSWLQPMTYEPRIDNLRLLIEAGWPQLVAWCDDFLDPAAGERLGDAIESTVNELSRLPQTIVHGDAKPDNMALRSSTGDDLDVVLLDWQAVGSGPPSWDVAYCLLLSLTTEDRRAHETQLLADYPMSLDGLDQSFLMGLVVAAALPALGDASNPHLKPLAVTIAERTIAALADHNVEI